MWPIVYVCLRATDNFDKIVYLEVVISESHVDKNSEGCLAHMSM
jgi:hypothetical protein